MSAYHDHLERARVAVSVHMVVAGSTQHRRAGAGEPMPDELRRNENAVCVPGDGLKHEEHMRPPVKEEDAAMAAPKHAPAVTSVGAEIQGEALGRDPARRVDERHEVEYKTGRLLAEGQ
jgi:hypothetical protein